MRDTLRKIGKVEERHFVACFFVNHCERTFKIGVEFRCFYLFVGVNNVSDVKRQI